MNEEDLTKSIQAIAQSMANTFSSYSRDVLQAFADERTESRAMLRDITMSSEKRLDRANLMVTQFANSADVLSKMTATIATEYADHIRKLTDERDKLLEMNAKQQEYIKLLQCKVDDRDEHIKSLLTQNAQQANATAQLIQRITSGPLVQNDFGVHH